MNKTGYRARISGLILIAAGMVFGSSCSFTELQAFTDGINAAANSLGANNNDHISFSDWLSSELDNL